MLMSLNAKRDIWYFDWNEMRDWLKMFPEVESSCSNDKSIFGHNIQVSNKTNDE